MNSPYREPGPRTEEPFHAQREAVRILEQTISTLRGQLAQLVNNQEDMLGSDFSEAYQRTLKLIEAQCARLERIAKGG